MNLTQIWNANRKFALKIFIGVWILWEIIVTISAFSLPKSYLSIADVKVEVSGADANLELMHSEAQTILSSNVLNNVIAGLNLNEKWGRRYFNGEKLKSSESLQILANRIKATPVKNSPVISIMSYSDSPEEAADIANALAEAYKLCHVEDQTTTQTNASSKSVSLIVSVQLIKRAQPNHRPCKPKIPFCIGIGVIISAIYGAIAAALAIGVRLLLKKLPSQKAANSNDKDDNNSPMPPIVSKY